MNDIYTYEKQTHTTNLLSSHTCSQKTEKKKKN